MAIRWCLEQVDSEWCAENVDGGLTPAERLVLVSLSHHHNEQTGRCDPGQGRIARETGIQVRTVGRSLRSLERKGLISWRRRWWDAGRLRPRSNYYELSLDLGAPLPDTPRPLVGTPPTTGQDPPDDRSTERKENVHVNAAAANKEGGAVKKEVEVVFASWSASLDSDVTHLLTDARASVIAAALEWATVEECCEAVAAWPHSDFHSGRTARNRKPQNRLDQLLKDREVLEELLDKKAHRNTSSRNKFLEDEEEDT